jgi:hypothetical protein
LYELLPVFAVNTPFRKKAKLNQTKFHIHEIKHSRNSFYKCYRKLVCYARSNTMKVLCPQKFSRRVLFPFIYSIFPHQYQEGKIQKKDYLHAMNPPLQPAALLKVPMHISTSPSQLNSSATPPPFFPQTNVP